MKIMKTKIRTLIAMVALGIIGFTNINATTDNKKEVNINVVSEKEENSTIETWMLNDAPWNAKAETAKTVIDSAKVEKALEVESWMTNEDLWK